MLHFLMKKIVVDPKRGFTLIELLVVIAIIGVLASIVLASLNTARQKARDTRRITDVKQIQLALEFFFDGVGGGQYPEAKAPVCTHTGTASGNALGLEVLEINNYMPKVPRDPNSNVTTGMCYRYAALTTGSRLDYHLGGKLEQSSLALTSDADRVTLAATYTNPFDGTSVGGATGCDATAGTPEPGGTERCFDVRN